MAEIADLPLAVRLVMRAYRWRRIDPVPWTSLAKPLAACRLALVSSAGLTAPGQPPFEARTRGGDVSFRDIPSDLDPRALRESHRSASFDHAPLREDPNLGLPLERVRELATAGRIGSVNRRHLSFMGSITAPGRLVRDTAPEAARRLVADGVEVALLVPV